MLKNIIFVPIIISFFFTLTVFARNSGGAFGGRAPVGFSFAGAKIVEKITEARAELTPSLKAKYIYDGDPRVSRYIIRFEDRNGTISKDYFIDYIQLDNKAVFHIAHFVKMASGSYEVYWNENLHQDEFHKNILEIDTRIKKLGITNDLTFSPLGYPSNTLRTRNDRRRLITNDKFLNFTVFGKFVENYANIYPFRPL